MTGSHQGGRWGALALGLAGLVTLPLMAVAVMSLGPGAGSALAGLAETVLPRYLANTVLLMACVGAGTAAIGVSAAWLVTLYAFPGSRALAWLSLLPLAVPGYVAAYAIVDLLEYAGPVQSGLRAVFGWQSARDYAFPEIRSRGGAIAVLTVTLYPYVFLLARAAFREQSGNLWDVARSLGAGPWRLFKEVGLPLARPGIAAGAAIAMMETAADFGTVEYFAVQTLTTGIFTEWLEAGSRAGAAQIAVMILALVLALGWVERRGRRRLRSAAPGKREVPRRRLRGWKAAVAGTICWTPFLLGFVLPVAVMASHAATDLGPWRAPGLGRALLNTLVSGGIAALVAVILAILLAYGARMSPLARRALPGAMLGYAAPGAVLGLGLLIPLAALDNRMADVWLGLTGTDPGLILTGSAAALVIAYVVRFFAVALGGVDAAMGRVAPSLAAAARALGRSPGGALRAVYVPLMRGSVLTALLLVFVDCAKELPATLLLRPFGYDTLATRLYEQASLERIAEASSAALLIVGVGALAVSVVARAAR